MATRPIPEGYHTVTPYLAVNDATKAIEFYKRAFGATEQARMDGPNGSIAHAELQIGDSRIMTSDPLPQSNTKAPPDLGGSSVSIFLYVEDVDSVVQDAVDAGATITMQPDNQFWGDRLGSVTDPFGHIWQIATHVEDLAPEEIERRGREFMASMSS